MEDERPFTIKRVAKSGSLFNDASMSVSAEWTTLNVSNVSTFTSEAEGLINIRGCTAHKECKDHHMMNKDRIVYMIPYGFAFENELKYSDGAILNFVIINGKKIGIDVVNYCFDRIKSKNGILRKHCNSTRPTNSMRLVASPSNGDKGVIFLPNAVFEKGKFLFLNEDSEYETCSIREMDIVVLGRYPSQRAENALPMKVMRTMSNDHSMRMPLNLCPRNNLDFDGDECWLYKPMIKDGIVKAEKAWERIWNAESDETIKEKMNRLVSLNGGRTDIDSAMYTTMPLEDMIDHEGGDMYDNLMLKPKSWKVMGNI